MRFGSVCSGIEAASVAWHPLGWRAAWLAEIDPFASAVLAHHYPEVPNLGDMNRLPARIRGGEVEAPDLFCGGTPCQAFSVAGLRQSLNDERGNLSLTFCEIANAIDDVRHAGGKPSCIVFWENVPGVLSTKDNAFGCFLGALAGCDYPIVPGGRWTDAGVVAGPQRAVAWRILDAQYFGLAQRRKRVFVVASAREGFDPAQVLLEWEGVRRDTAPSREAREGAAVCPTLRAGGNSTGGDRPPGTDVDTADSLQVCYGGNNTAGPINVATACNAHGGAKGRLDFESETFVAQAPVGVDGYNGALTGAVAATMGTRGSSETATGPQVMVPVAHAFDARQSGVIQYGDKTGPLDTDGHTVGVLAFSSKDHGADASEDAKNPTAVAVALRGREGGATAELGDDLQNCLRASGGGGDKPHVLTAMQVRRLTPRECERLQGFPDGYTAIPWRGKPASECPDGPRYKALGNSWAVPVVRWIGRRIDSAVRRCT